MLSMLRLRKLRLNTPRCRKQTERSAQATLSDMRFPTPTATFSSLPLPSDIGGGEGGGAVGELGVE